MFNLTNNIDEKDLKSAQRIATYLNRAFSSNKLKSVLGVDFENNHDLYCTVGNSVINYVIATRDFSEEGFVGIMEEAKRIGFEYKPGLRAYEKSDNKERLKEHELEEFTLKAIASKVKEQLQIREGEDKTEAMQKVLNRVNENCMTNGFYTHSFSGALIDEIDANGLDISREKFLEEYKVAESLDRPQHTTGELYLTPPSELTFHFADTPERLRFGILRTDLQRNTGESTENYYKRKLERSLEIKRKTTVKSNEEEISRIQDSATKLCEFYGRTTSAGIAVIPKSALDYNHSQETPEVVPERFLYLLRCCTDMAKQDAYGLMVKGGKIPRNYFALSTIPSVDSLTLENQRIRVKADTETGL